MNGDVEPSPWGAVLPPACSPRGRGNADSSMPPPPREDDDAPAGMMSPRGAATTTSSAPPFSSFRLQSNRDSDALGIPPLYWASVRVPWFGAFDAEDEARRRRDLAASGPSFLAPSAPPPTDRAQRYCDHHGRVLEEEAAVALPILVTWPVDGKLGDEPRERAVDAIRYVGVPVKHTRTTCEDARAKLNDAPAMNRRSSSHRMGRPTAHGNVARHGPSDIALFVPFSDRSLRGDRRMPLKHAVLLLVSILLAVLDTLAAILSAAGIDVAPQNPTDFIVANSALGRNTALPVRRVATASAPAADVAIVAAFLIWVLASNTLFVAVHFRATVVLCSVAIGLQAGNLAFQVAQIGGVLQTLRVVVTVVQAGMLHAKRSALGFERLSIPAAGQH